MIHVCTPFDLDKNLGRAYNETFRNCPDNDWLCLIDYDVMFLTPRGIQIMYQYVTAFPDTGIFTCRTNRIHPMQTCQLHQLVPSENDSIRYWQKEAINAEDKVPDTTRITQVISGFLMLISKQTWKDFGGFPETGKALGIDNAFSEKILGAGKKILCMEGLVVWHSYRLHDITDKSHLR